MMEKKNMITEEEEEEEEEEGPSSTIFAMPSWKLYDNPFFNYTFPINHQNHRIRFSATRFHHLNHSMEARVRELKEELELERRLRKKVESLNKALAKELKEERQRREPLERELEGLSGETRRAKAEMERLRAEVVEERRMMKISEVLREERVHMKMLEAKLVMEEKFLELSSSPSTPQLRDTQGTKAEADPENKCETKKKQEKDSPTGELRSGDSENVRGFGLKENNKLQRQQQRKEVENPHIRRGIIGYVEFSEQIGPEPCRRPCRFFSRWDGGDERMEEKCQWWSEARGSKGSTPGATEAQQRQQQQQEQSYSIGNIEDLLFRFHTK